MGKNKDSELDKDSRKRLEKLVPNWDSTPSAWGMSLEYADLRLLLEHHAPLQDLIRAIAGAPAGTAPSVLAQETNSLREQVVAAEDLQEKVQTTLAQTTDELVKAHQELKVISGDLERCSALGRQLNNDKQALEQTRLQLEKQVQQLQRQLDDAKAKLSKSGQAPAELRLLRQDAELAQLLGLTNLPADDTRALIQMVAVLAQRDSLERLWGVLKDRSEISNRAASDEETALLAAALTWYNHNWQSRPYQLIDATTRTTYDYERQLRSRHTPGGETVSEVRLPGIADGSNKPVCKALVITQ